MSLSAFLKVVAVIALAGVLLTFRSPSMATSSGTAPFSERKIAPDFALIDAYGSQVSLSDYRGKVVLLNFWATWCGPCQNEIPWFVEFQTSYQSRGFTILGVSMDDDGWQVIKPFARQKGVNYPVLLGNEKVADLYGGVDALPSTFLIDRTGRIAFAHMGLVNRHDFEQEILRLIAQ